MIAPRLCAVICAVLFWTPAFAEVPRVVADTPVAQSLAAMVMGDLAVPDLLLDRGADPHDFQLRPSKARSLANADLVVWTSPSLSPWMVRPLDSLVTAQVIALEDVDGVRRQRFDMSSLLAGGNLADEIGGYDPHLWLDPRTPRRGCGKSPRAWPRSIRKTPIAMPRMPRPPSRRSTRFPPKWPRRLRRSAVPGW